MRKSKTKKANIRRRIFSGMFVVSLVIIMISVSFSWFSTGSKATVTGIQMSVADEGSLSFLVGDVEQPIVNFPIDADQEPLKAVSGNGKYFYTAELDENGNPIYSQIISGKLPEISEGDAIQDPKQKELLAFKAAGIYAFDFSLKSEDDGPVYLYPKSQEDANGNRKTSGVTPVTEDGKNSPYGEFSPGYISGAIRIAILQYDPELKEYHPTFIWAPDTDVELYSDDENNQMGVKIEGVSYEESYIYLGKIIESEGDSSDGNDSAEINIDQIEIDTRDEVNEIGTQSGAQVEDKVTYAWGDLSQKLEIGTLTKGEAVEFRLVIWVDGNDRECHNALLNGKFTVSLHFGL